MLSGEGTYDFTLVPTMLRNRKIRSRVESENCSFIMCVRSKLAVSYTIAGSDKNHKCCCCFTTHFMNHDENGTCHEIQCLVNRSSIIP
mmetsp:Transcript_4980/g.7270  ORF Transcript_4980/g.7270 Transcript_4980/m.7270 type:complete len:88 (+) Transcript_4980:1502-1765(+)